MFYPYKTGSNSVKNLSEAMNMKVIKREGSKFKGHKDKIVINWGCTYMPEEVMKCNILNKPAAVAIASNKLTFFESVKNVVNIPEYTTKTEVAKEWLDSGSVVLGREILNGHSGQGIFVIDSEYAWNNLAHEHFKMYVKYIPKKEEYRVHVIGNDIVDVRRKVARKEFKNKEMMNWKIRNYDNGFIFAKNDVNPNDDVLIQSVNAINKCGLDFGAVDVIWNAFRNKAYVLEVNTAPGLEGSSVDNYAEAFDNICKDILRYKAYEAKKVAIKDIIYNDLEKFKFVQVIENPFAKPPQPFYHGDVEEVGQIVEEVFAEYEEEDEEDF